MQSIAEFKGILKCGHCNCLLTLGYTMKAVRRFIYYRCIKDHARARPLATASRLSSFAPSGYPTPAARANVPTSVARNLAKQGCKRVRDRFPTRFKMAEHLRIDSSYLTRVVRLGYLSPYIVEKIAAGDLPHVSLETLMKLQTPVWAEQHKALGILC